MPSWVTVRVHPAKGPLNEEALLPERVEELVPGIRYIDLDRVSDADFEEVS